MAITILYPESDFADVVKREPLKHVLEIKDFLVLCGGTQKRQEPLGEFGVDHVLYEVAEGFGGELVDGDLPLELPFVAVDIEDSGTEEIVQSVEMCGALLVNREMSVEDVLYVGGVGGEDGFAAEGELEGQVGTNEWITLWEVRRCCTLRNKRRNGMRRRKKKTAQGCSIVDNKNNNGVRVVVS
ncbi:hypothetical protein PIB30_053022 [Stylosanthes scabra]|uniref:Uncharacterized protein n=1 Tax=Stylosanthes scabra TaxID=79078 RepID=A0ABU6QHZ9_9FABA|nr:hypothetical protein [Stylosanthes scabra]